MRRHHHWDQYGAHPRRALLQRRVPLNSTHDFYYPIVSPHFGSLHSTTRTHNSIVYLLPLLTRETFFLPLSPSLYYLFSFACIFFFFFFFALTELMTQRCTKMHRTATAPRRRTTVNNSRPGQFS